MEKVCAVISVHEGGIGLAGSQENYSPKVSSSPEGYIKSNSRVCISIAIYRPADKNGRHGGSGSWGDQRGWGGSLRCTDQNRQNVIPPMATASHSAPTLLQLSRTEPRGGREGRREGEEAEEGEEGWAIPGLTALERISEDTA